MPALGPDVSRLRRGMPKNDRFGEAERWLKTPVGKGVNQNFRRAITVFAHRQLLTNISKMQHFVSTVFTGEKTMIVSDLDLIERANQMIEHYGEDAENASITNADACLEKGDFEGSLNWTRIKLIVAEITAEENEEAVH